MDNVFLLTCGKSQNYMHNEINKVELRNLKFEDYKGLKTSLIASHPEMVPIIAIKQALKNC